MVPQNAFQALMRRWTSLGAYNAMHLLWVAGRVEPDRWLKAIAAALAPLGFKPPAGIEIIHGGFAAGIAAELNRPFAEEDSPLRFFVIPVSPDDYYLGITFDHWIADSHSVRVLMRRIFAGFQQPDTVRELPAIRLNTATFDESFGRASVVRTLLECLRNYLRHRRAYRPPLFNAQNFSVSFEHRQLPDGLIGRIQNFARKQGAKVNDVFLAAAAMALHRHSGFATRKKSFRRNSLSMSVAVDIRPFAKQPMDDVFGFFLGYFSVLLRNIESASLGEIVALVVSQTQSAKSAGRVLHLFRGFKLANIAWDFLRSPRKRASMFHRSLPMLGGISNVNLTDSWADREPAILDYVRVSPAGPILPIVFTLTTIQDRLSLCVTHRDAAFSREQVAAMISDFVGRLEGIPSP